MISTEDISGKSYKLVYTNLFTSTDTLETETNKLQYKFIRLLLANKRKEHPMHTSCQPVLICENLNLKAFQVPNLLIQQFDTS